MSTVRLEGDSPAKPAKFPIGTSGWRRGSSDSPRDSDAPVNCAHRKKTSFCRRFVKAAEGIRTLDLLHGKQSLRRRFRTNLPARRFPESWGPGGLSGIY